MVKCDVTKIIICELMGFVKGVVIINAGEGAGRNCARP